MKKDSSSLLVLVLATFAMAPGWAQAHFEGFYISSDIGANFASGVRFTGDSNDVASHCDALTNPGLTGCRDNDFRYTNTFVRDWAVDFDRGQGILAGAAVGYSFAKGHPNSPLRGFRVELEYFYRESKYDQSSRVEGLSGATQQKINRGEFESGPFEHLGSITSHNLFGNVYYDFAKTSQFTPYIGIGGGFGVTDAGWSTNWTRTNDKQALRNDLRADNRSDLAMNEAYIDRLAVSSSVAHTTLSTLSDTLWGFQVLFGVDYALTDAVSAWAEGAVRQFRFLQR